MACAWDQSRRFRFLLTVIDLQMHVGRAVALLDTLQRRQLGPDIVSDGMFLRMRRLVSATISGIS